MKKQKNIRIVLLLALCLLLSGCRVRTGTGGLPENAGVQAAESAGNSLREHESDTDAYPEEQEKIEIPGGRTRESPEASRKEYDENRPAEILPGTERTVHGAGEGSGYSAAGESGDPEAAKLSETAERAATRTVAAEEAAQMGTDEDAEAADSAMTYFSVLLRERTGSLFECQRMNVYWETPEDHRTVFKTSAEHSMILDAGAYDVSARLLEDSLRVDDGWIGRKNPDVIVKAVNRRILGSGVASPDAARKLLSTLLAREGWSAMSAVKNQRVVLLSEELLEAPHLRLAAMLIIAKTANPDIFTDVSIENALAMLGEEAAGVVPDGVFYYTSQGGF